MAKTTDTPQTFADGLKQLLPKIAQVMAAPDADMRFCQAMMVAISGKLKGGGQANQGATAGVGGAPGPGGGGPGPGGPGSPPPGMGIPGGPAGGGAGNQQMPNLTGPTTPPGANGLAPGLSPNPDELRRVISQNAAGG